MTVISAMETDNKQLVSIITNDTQDGVSGTEQSGYMTAAARLGDVKKATKYVFGQLIDAPALPDTVLSQFVACNRSSDANLSQIVSSLVLTTMASIKQFTELSGVKHKEEGERRKKLVAEDRQNIRDELKKYPTLLYVDSDRVVSIVIGCIASDKVNVQNAVKIREEMATQFRKRLPEEFYQI